MPLEKNLGHLFKPEIKNYGQQEFSKGIIFISNNSDTQIQASIKSMIPIRISLKSESITSPDITATCTCSVFNKGQLCKHIWGTLLMTEQKHPDFLENKINIEMIAKIKSPTSVANKEKQTEFKKQQYEKQKEWTKNLRRTQKKKLTETPREIYSAEIESALSFFSVNGFTIDKTSDLETLNKAKKTLHRVFHPDKGGSHAEAIALNTHFDVLTEFLSRLSNK